MKLTIRNAILSDSPSIAELSGQLGYASSKDDTQNRLLALLNTPLNCVYVAQDDEKVIGWIHAFYAQRIESNPFVEIGGLVVDTHYRHKGVGKLLVETIAEWATSKQCHHLRVRCNAVRKESHLFYENLGFETLKVQNIFGKTLY